MVHFDAVLCSFFRVFEGNLPTAVFMQIGESLMIYVLLSLMVIPGKISPKPVLAALGEIVWTRCTPLFTNATYKTLPNNLEMASWGD